MSIKNLAVAATLLAASVSANAAYVSPAASYEVDGEMILTIWNTDTARALSVDLGVRSSQFINGTAAVQSWSLNPADVAWMGTGNIRWNVAGASSTFTENFPADFGYYFSAAEGRTAEGGQGFVEILPFATAFLTYQAAIPGMRDAGDPAVNLTYRSEGLATYAGSGSVWGSAAGNVSTTFGVFSDAAADQILRGWTGGFIGRSLEEIENGETALVILDDKYWRLDLANNSVSYVPVPAAAWLFGSALLGLAGAVRRRRKIA